MRQRLTTPPNYRYEDMILRFPVDLNSASLNRLIARRLK